MVRGCCFVNTRCDHHVSLQVKDLIFTGVGHTKTILKEVKDQVLLGQTGLVVVFGLMTHQM